MGVFCSDTGLNQIACVIMMPFELDLPKEGFLADVKRLCEKNGAVLHFLKELVKFSDEKMTGGQKENGI